MVNILIWVHKMHGDICFNRWKKIGLKNQQYKM